MEDAQHPGDEENDEDSTETYAGPTPVAPTAVAVIAAAATQQQYQNDNQYQHHGSTRQRAAFLSLLPLSIIWSPVLRASLRAFSFIESPASWLLSASLSVAAFRFSAALSIPCLTSFLSKLMCSPRGYMRASDTPLCVLSRNRLWTRIDGTFGVPR